MRDGTVGGDGYGPAPTARDLGWDEGPLQGDARPGSPEAPEIPEPRSPHPGSHRHGGRGTPKPDAPTGSGHRRSGERGRKQAGGKRRVLKWTAIGTSAAVLVTAGAAYGYYAYLSGKIRKGQRVSGATNAVKPKADAQGHTPLNILILGSDSRADAKDRQLGGASDSSGERADVIMIAHLSADRSNMSLVSIPRDTRVHIPECTDPKTHQVYPKSDDIINASLAHGGAGCTLATVQNLTNLYIDHWLKIDFAGVVKMADVLGGAQVCVQQNVDDHPTRDQPGGSHLHLTAGTHTVKDAQALQWLRTRHAFGSDAMRSRAQHMYMSSLLRNLRSQNLFSSPTRLNSIAVAAMSAFEVSSEIATPPKLYDLSMQLKSIPPNRTTMLTMPHLEDPLNNAHYVPAPSAATVWSLMRNDVAMDSNGKAKTPGSPATKAPATPAGPHAAAPSTITVTVANGTAGTEDGVPTQHRAGAIKQYLVAKGFTRAAADQQPAPTPTTTLVYPTGSGAQGRSNALSVAAALGIPAVNVKASATAQTITLTVGADWKTGADYAVTVPKAGAVPIDADATNGAEASEKNCMYVEPTYRF